MTLNRIQNRDLSWHTRQMRHGRRRTAKAEKQSRTTVKLIAEARTKKAAEDVAERLNAEEGRWSA
jgi:hypothetical protein